MSSILLIIAFIIIPIIVLVIYHDYRLYRRYRDEASQPADPEFDVKLYQERSVNFPTWMVLKCGMVTLCYTVAIEAVSLTAGESYSYNVVGDLMGGSSSNAYRNGPMATIIGLMLPLIFMRATIPSIIEFFRLPANLRKSINRSILLIYFPLYALILPFLLLRC